MAFTPGHKLAIGRPKGSLNRRTESFLAVLEREQFCPVTAMIECYRDARKLFDNYGVIYQAITEARSADTDRNGTFHAPLQDEAHKYLKIAGDMAKEITAYSHPKLKAIERVVDKPLDGMSPQEKLEAMKEAVKFLEAQLKGEKIDDTPGA